MSSAFASSSARFREWNCPLQCSHRPIAIGASLTILSLRGCTRQFATDTQTEGCSMSDKADYERDLVWQIAATALYDTRRNRANGRRVSSYRVSPAPRFRHHPRKLFLDLQQAKCPRFVGCSLNSPRMFALCAVPRIHFLEVTNFLR